MKIKAVDYLPRRIRKKLDLEEGIKLLLKHEVSVADMSRILKVRYTII